MMRNVFKFALGLCVLLVVYRGYRFWVNATQATGSTDRSDIAVEVGSDWTAAQIGATLQEKGVIPSAFEYRLYALLNSLAQHPKAGTYHFFAPSNYRFIAKMFARGPGRPEAELQIIEGWSLKDVGALMTSHGVSTSTFAEQAGDPLRGIPMANTWRDKFAFLSSLPADATLEGYLFPNTYRVFADDLPNGLISKQLQEFENEVRPVAEKAQSEGKSLRDVVILASILEKEVSRPEDRRIVAGIFLNRLRIGMPLQSDATVNYLTQSGRSRSTTKDLAIDSPFNTYRNRGLPPAPICNPSLDALMAAVSPKPSEYLYFLTDGKGNVLYAKTFEEHQRNRAKAF